MSNGFPITPDPSPPAPGIPQPVFGSGDADTPSTPIDITGSPIIPTSSPPGGIGQIGDPVGVPTFPPGPGDTAPVEVPTGPQVGPAIGTAPVPPSIPGVQQPQFGGGSATIPASLFPEFTTGGPQQPIVLTSIFQIGTVPPPLPTTPGVAPIVMSQEWGQPPPPTPGPPPPDTEPPEEEDDEPPADEGTEPASAQWVTPPKPRPKRTRKKR